MLQKLYLRIVSAKNQIDVVFPELRQVFKDYNYTLLQKIWDVSMSKDIPSQPLRS